MFSRPFGIWLQRTILVEDKICRSEVHRLSGELVGDIHKNFALKARIGRPDRRAHDERNSGCSCTGKYLADKNEYWTPAKNVAEHLK
jgi:hypothetical protein